MESAEIGQQHQDQDGMSRWSSVTLTWRFSAHVKKTVQIKYDGTVEDSRGGQDVKLNRLELNMYESSYDCVPRVSYDSEHNHIKPMTFSDFQVKNDFEI